MGVLTVKLPPSLEAKLNSLVRSRGQRKSEVVREAIERLVEDAKPQTSAHDLLKDLKKFRGSRDLSTNPKYMKDFGE